MKIVARFFVLLSLATTASLYGCGSGNNSTASPIIPAPAPAAVNTSCPPNYALISTGTTMSCCPGGQPGPGCMPAGAGMGMGQCQPPYMNNGANMCCYNGSCMPMTNYGIGNCPPGYMMGAQGACVPGNMYGGGGGYYGGGVWLGYGVGGGYSGIPCTYPMRPYGNTCVPY
jgi:hypothetical protein